MGVVKRRLQRGVLVLVLLLLAGAGGAAGWLQRPLPLQAASVELSIEPGTTPRAVAQQWVQAGVQTSPWLLYQWFRWSGDSRLIRAGSYEIERGATPRDLMRKMVQGEETLETVRLIDGWTFRQWRAELGRAKALRPASAAMNDEQLMAALGAPGVHPEGRFFPDTYAYSRGVSDLTVMRRAYQAMQRRLDEVWRQRTPELPLKTVDEALILASIVEKETGTAADRGQVAGVFVNRLKLGMPLQTDPTLIYGLGEKFDGDLRRRDLAAAGAYNTYLNAGLPPTPIAMPGLAALRATVRPASTRALYFVARGDGSSQFSDTLAEHNRAVDRYQRAPARAKPSRND